LGFKSPNQTPARTLLGLRNVDRSTAIRQLSQNLKNVTRPISLTILLAGVSKIGFAGEIEELGISEVTRTVIVAVGMTAKVVELGDPQLFIGSSFLDPPVLLGYSVDHDDFNATWKIAAIEHLLAPCVAALHEAR
jgi:hypothetical protein